MTVVMYGIPNCDTIKKAKKWLNDNGVAFEFHDYRKQGVPQHILKQACDALGWEAVLNKRGTTFRQLTDEQKAAVSADSVIELLSEYPAMIKRPLLHRDAQFFIGFKAPYYEEIFA